ncbi:hypothetical protein E1N02_11675 [Staphylococcus epidermidis]|uniref:Uncharacterized protein n=1 Tax=Staphylococcus epidermidis (strain ATCC 12228 / FDA PCI 1200) TaxID=176280 RepID=A0A0H2VL35_STAES|nr:hypothetical protein SE_p407 [Staphylococcus epidermidis ATCC 12228]AVG08464.1 hypothetical protein AL521_01725 [Staphylococcus epidermidis]RRJ56255.1 hypothetical protein EIM20_28385 [Pseudomonas aeruginosa]KAB1898180.1 hypothetical protein F8174_09900 [Staphylococcus epidermidis ATCC 12228]KAB2209977.1 hypothetical protein F9B44_11895 [Staphylococcus epidermidis]
MIYALFLIFSFGKEMISNSEFIFNISVTFRVKFRSLIQRIYHKFSLCLRHFRMSHTKKHYFL